MSYTLTFPVDQKAATIITSAWGEYGYPSGCIVDIVSPHPQFPTEVTLFKIGGEATQLPAKMAIIGVRVMENGHVEAVK